MKLVISVFFICGIVYPAIAQDYWSNRYDLDNGNDYGSQIILLDDQVLIHVGALCELNTRICGGLMWIDFDGELMEKVVWYDSIRVGNANAVGFRNDTIFVNMHYNGIPEYDPYFILMFDVDGNIIGQHSYTHPSLNFAGAGSIDIDDNRVFAAYRFRDTTSGRLQMGVRAFDNAWNVLWNVKIPDNSFLVQRYDFKATGDGGFVIAYVLQINSNDNRGIIEKYSNDGKIEWQTELSEVYSQSSPWMTIDLHPDGGYVGNWIVDTFALFLSPKSNYIFKLDAQGAIEWERARNWNEYVQIIDIIAAKNGDIVCFGTEQRLYTGPESPPEFDVGYITRLTAQGETRWVRRIYEQRDGAVYYDFYAGIELENGDLIATGLMFDTIFGTPEDPTPGNVWVVKVDSNGCFSPGCGHEQFLTVVEDISPPRTMGNTFIVFPNPARTQVTLGAVIGVHLPSGSYRYVMHDSMGRVVATESFNPYRFQQIDIRGGPGLYSLAIFKDGVLVQVSKVVKVDDD